MSKSVFSYLKPVLFCTLIGLICSIIYFCVCAILVSHVDIPSSLYYWISLLGITMMSFLTSFSCAKIVGQKALLIGILSAIAIILLFLAGSIVIHTGLTSMLTKSLIIVLVSIIGAVLGVS